jgi:hypothetical protein
MKTIRLTGLTDRKYGIEIELFATRSNPSDHQAIVNALRAAGVDCTFAGYTHSVSSHWKVVTDGSVVTPDGRRGLELVSPPLSGEAGLKEIERVCEALATIGAWVNRSCGFHVHHDASDLSVGNIIGIAKTVKRFGRVFDGLMAESRRNNQYATHMTDSDIESLERCESLDSLRRRFPGDSTERYHTFNVCAFQRHGTVEFRQHGGTVEARKMIPWIILTQGLVEKGKASKSVRGKVMGATGDGLDMLFRTAGLRTCMPWGQKLNPETEARARQTTEWFSARAAEFGVIRVSETSANRSRARRATQTPAERVAEAVAAAPVAAEGTPAGQ